MVPRLATPESYHTQQQQQQLVFGATPGPDGYFTAHAKAPWMQESSIAGISPVAFGGFTFGATAATPAAATPTAAAAVEGEEGMGDSEQQQEKEELTP